MTVFKHPKGKSFRYDFWWLGDRYTGNTHQTSQRDAELVESDIKKRLRLQAGGIAPPDCTASPHFQDWAEVYLEHILTREKSRIKRPERIRDLLRVVLRFWGRRPAPEVTGKWGARAGEPYHDLRLTDPIDDPMKILEFEDWMATKKIAGQTKNQYRSTLSRMFALALHPAYRKRTGATMNPFLGIPRDRGGERTSTVTVDELRAWLQHASYHIRLALAIAALAPKFRLANVLALRWDTHIDRARRLIMVHEHKTDADTRRPLVVPIEDQLWMILENAWRRNPQSKFVITYRGRPVKAVRSGVKAAAQAAGLKWGRFEDDGVTFHTMRHYLPSLTMSSSIGPLSRSI